MHGWYPDGCVLCSGPLPVEQIEAQLRAVLADQPGKDEAPVGVMSAIDRDWAADLRPEFEALNKASVADLDGALFCLTLDDSAPEEETEVCAGAARVVLCPR